MIKIASWDKIASWEFARETVKAPWVKEQVEQWLMDNPFEGLTCKLSTHPARQNRAQEGHLIDISIPLNFNDRTLLSNFSDWFSRFRKFTERLPQKWNEKGLEWNSGHEEEIQRYLRDHLKVGDEPQNNTTHDEQIGEPDPAKAKEKNSSNSNPSPRNLIYFGAPGTGKSHELNHKMKEAFVDRYERVTFYPTYSYAQFVGCYKPVMQPVKDVEGKDTEKDEITYEFVPGPFLRVLEKAMNNPGQNHCLVIEEINRANAAAVFGDVFQLLDRDENGESEYDIAATEDMKRHLDKALSDIGREQLKKLSGDGNLKIPANMFIWATMNSADQGVFPMDTAFKRRWEFKYIGIDVGVKDGCEKWTIGDSGFLWNKVRKFLNDRLTNNGVNEDKLMGPWFVKPENGSVVSKDQFDSKVLMYLWEDAARMCRRKFFDDKIKTYPDLLKCWPDAFKGIDNWNEVKSGWLPPRPGATIDGAGAPEVKAESQTEAMSAAATTGSEAQSPK